MKSLFLFPIITFSVLSASAAEVCQKFWTPVTKSGEIVQAGMILTPQLENSKIKSVGIRDLDGKNQRNIELPRPADQLQNFEFIGENLVYTSGTEVFFFNPKTKEEKKLNLPANAGLSSGSFGRNEPTGYIYPHGHNGVILNGDTGNSIVLPANSSPSVKGSSATYKKNSTTHVLTSLDSNAATIEITAPESSRVALAEENLLTIDDNNDPMKKEAYIKQGKKWVKAPTREQSVFSFLMPNGNLAYVKYTAKSGDRNAKINNSNYRDFNASTEIYDPQGKKVSAINNAYYSFQKGLYAQIDFQSAQPQMKFYTESEYNKLLEGKNATPIASQTSGDSNFTFSKNWAAVFDGDKTTLTNLKDNRKVQVPGKVAYMEEGKDGSKLILNRGNGGSYKRSTLDLKTKKELNLGYDYLNSDPNFNHFYKYDMGGIATPTRQCFNDNIAVISDDCNCRGNGTDFDADFANANFSELQKVAIESLCQSTAFSPTTWDAITPPITKGNISEKQALLYLKRFQKQGAYQAKHLPVLYAILKSSVVDNHPKQVENALQILAGTQPGLTHFLMKELKLADKLKKKAEVGDQARCEDPATEAFRKNTFNNLKSKAESSTVQPDEKKGWENLTLFKDELKTIPEQQKEKLIDNIAESLSQKAAVDSDLTGLFQSKLYYFSKKYAMSLFDKEAKDATDLTLALSSGNQTPVILSSSEIKGVDGQAQEVPMDSLVPVDKDRYGFHYERLPNLAIPQDLPVGSTRSKEFAWETAKGKFTAKADMKVLEPLSEMIKKDPAPPYKQMKADGKLAGAMVIGSNLSSHAGLVDHYISFYQNEGYEFSEPKEVSTAQFLKQEIQSGSLDYLVKEAHSDGDENNLLRVTKKSTLLEGKRKARNGAIETIYLLGPTKDTYSSELISNQDFGSWVRGRKETQPFVYFNTSCSSTRKVIAEIGAAHSKNFIPYPSLGTVHTFSDRADNPMRVMLDGFLKEKSYEGIRTEMKKTPLVQKGDDRMLFPDEPDYDQQIRSNLKLNLDTKITVKNSKGQVLNIDEQIDH